MTIDENLRFTILEATGSNVTRISGQVRVIGNLIVAKLGNLEYILRCEFNGETATFYRGDRIVGEYVKA